MNILDFKAADLGGAVAHVAASQLYQLMTEDDDDAMGPRTWFGSDPDDDAGIEKDVLDLARYVNGRDIPAEQLWRWAGINGIVINEGDDYRALPFARRLAFEIFTDTCSRAHHRLELAQLDAQKLIPLNEETSAPGLKLEDSIFEPHGSLGDQEEYQKQWLKDQEAADRRRLEEQVAAAAEAAAGESQSIGEPIAGETDDKPAGLSAGVMEEINETEAAVQGQAQGNTPPADPAAQGSVSEVADDGLSPECGSGPDGSSGDTGDHAPGGEELAGTLAKPTGAETGADGAADGAHTDVENEARIGGETLAPRTQKPRKGKSSSRK